MPEIYKNGRLYGTAKAFTGATTQANGSSGLVPAPAIADKDKVLKGDGTWGEAGASLPSGGTQGQYLVKQSSTEGDADWETLSVFGGATSSTAGSSGVVPAPSAGDEEKFLKADGSWGNAGSSDYSSLTNKPSINNVTLSGNKTSNDLGLVKTTITDLELGVVNGVLTITYDDGEE